MPGADFSSDVGGGWSTDTLPGGQGGFEVQHIEDIGGEDR